MDYQTIKDFLKLLQEQQKGLSMDGEVFLRSFTRPIPIDYIFEIESYGFIKTMKPSPEDGPTSARWYICITEKGQEFLKQKILHVGIAQPGNEKQERYKSQPANKKVIAPKNEIDFKAWDDYLKRNNPARILLISAIVIILAKIISAFIFHFHAHETWFQAFSHPD